MTHAEYMKASDALHRRYSAKHEQVERARNYTVAQYNAAHSRIDVACAAELTALQESYFYTFEASV